MNQIYCATVDEIPDLTLRAHEICEEVSSATVVEMWLKLKQRCVAAEALLVEAVTMRNDCVAAEQNTHNERIASRYGKKADEVFYRILAFNQTHLPVPKA